MPLTELLRLRAPLIGLRWRYRWQNVAKMAAIWAPLPLMSGVVLRWYQRFFPESALTRPYGLGLCLLCLGIALLAVIRAAMAVPPDRELSLRIDRSLGKTDIVKRQFLSSVSLPIKMSLVLFINPSRLYFSLKKSAPFDALDENRP